MAKGNNLEATPAGTAAERTDAGESGRSAEEIRQHIAATRESITDTVDRLNDRFQETLDWRTYVARYPMVAVGVAVGLGFFVSRIFKPRPTPMDRVKDALADSFEEFTDHLRDQFDGVGVRRTGLGQTVKAAATGALVKAASDLLHQRFFGREEIQYETEETAHQTDFPHSNVSRMAAPDYRSSL